MAHTTDAKSARITLEQAINKAPAPTNFKQASLLNQFEIKAAELKILIAQINAAGGITDTTTAADVAALSAVL